MQYCEQPGSHIATVTAGVKLIQRPNQALMDKVVGVLLAPKQSTRVSPQSGNRSLDFGQHSGKPASQRHL